MPRFIKLFLLIIFTFSSKLVFPQGLKIPEDGSLPADANATIATGKLTIVLLPDTQFYTAEPQGTNGGSNAIFKRQIRWIINNRAQRNIIYVGQLGDCTEHGDKYEIEWRRSDTAMSLLESSGLTGLPEGIPYGI